MNIELVVLAGQLSYYLQQINNYSCQHLAGQQCNLPQITYSRQYSRLLNKHRGTLINFGVFFQRLRAY